MRKVEGRANLKKRLAAEGRWAEAVAYRELLKRQGVSPPEAQRRTAQRFSPLPAGAPRLEEDLHVPVTAEQKELLAEVAKGDPGGLAGWARRALVEAAKSQAMREAVRPSTKKPPATSRGN